MTTTVIIRFQFEGTHHWPGCNIPEVMYLRNKHRHVFHVESEKEVSHEDREIEIIMLKKKMKDYCERVGDWETASCEMIAKELLIQFKLSSCQVLEDNENGAKVTA